MAYDPKDPADKKIVDDLIAAALADQQETHEADIAGLKKKNTELLGKIRNQEGLDPSDLAALETDNNNLKKQLKDATKQLKEANEKLNETTSELTTERQFAHNTLVDGGLTQELVKAGVAPAFLPAVKALLAPQVVVKTDATGRKAFVGDKSLADHVAAWSQGDEGKNYIAAPSNSGAGAPGAKGNGSSGKTMTRAEYDTKLEADPMFASKFFAEGGTFAD